MSMDDHFKTSYECPMCAKPIRGFCMLQAPHKESYACDFCKTIIVIDLKKMDIVIYGLKDFDFQH